MRLVAILLALSLSGCFPLPLGCRTSWFNRCSPMPEGTTESCARGSLARPDLYPGLPYWSQGQTAEGWQAVLAACSACMQLGDSAAACSKRMWGR